LIELLVTMAIIAALLAIAAPRYLGNVQKAKEAALKEDLATLRDVLDKHYADHGRYPATLVELVSQHYLRRVPVDPFTDSDRTWVLVPPADPAQGGVFDVHSGALDRATDGSRVAEW
jgi:general secretion pathway protein G